MMVPSLVPVPPWAQASKVTLGRPLPLSPGKKARTSPFSTTVDETAGTPLLNFQGSALTQRPAKPGLGNFSPLQRCVAFDSQNSPQPANGSCVPDQLSPPLSFGRRAESPS